MFKVNHSVSLGMCTCLCSHHHDHPLNVPHVPVPSLPPASTQQCLPPLAVTHLPPVPIDV